MIRIALEQFLWMCLLVAVFICMTGCTPQVKSRALSGNMYEVYVIEPDHKDGDYHVTIALEEKAGELCQPFTTSNFGPGAYHTLQQRVDRVAGGDKTSLFVSCYNPMLPPTLEGIRSKYGVQQPDAISNMVVPDFIVEVVK